MLGLIVALIFVLIAVITVQIGKVNELAGKIRGEEESERQTNNRTAFWLVLFMIGFLFYCVWSAWDYKDVMLGYGPHMAASEHGDSLDHLFNVTLFFTGIVFIITQVALFWFSYKYRAQEGRKALFFVHSTKLELIWTAIPAVVMTYLVVQGLVAWNTIMPDVGPDEEYMEIEATGYQFAWELRYPGPDGKLGTKDYTLIEPGINSLGQDWNDKKNIDDFLPTELVLPVGQKVRVRITAKDVLHNFYLPHFRVKMDAIPGLPTYFIFTPKTTTQEYRERLSTYPEWQELSDPTDPESPQRWEVFDYELACAELCGKGHYSMRRVVRVLERSEFDEWAASQSSYYMSNIRNTDNDPFIGTLLPIEIEARSKELNTEFTDALSSEEANVALTLKHVFFQTGSSILRDDSQFELEELSNILKKNNNVKVELGGHTDNTGRAENNMILSKERANVVMNYLISKGVNSSNLSAKGYGQNVPLDTNESEEGRKNNRRTELRIISK